MIRAQSRRFRLKQVGLVLLILSMVVPWMTDSSAEAPLSEELRGFDSRTHAPGDEPDSTPIPRNGPGLDVDDEWATITSDDLSYQASRSASSSEIYGMVGRDPWYEYDTNDDDYPDEVNRTFLENMVADMANMGVRWIRFEFRAEVDVPEGPGPVDWSKHDWFINELLPKYNMQALGLLGSGLVGDKDETYEFHRINDDSERNGRNRYTRAYIDHVEQVAERYGDNIAAFEILNEPNHNQILSWETRGRVEEVDPLIYGRLVVDSYEAIKEHSPDSLVVAGALLHHNRNGTDRHFDWLERVYDSRHIHSYHSANDDYPWDAVSIHPYFLDVDAVIEHMFKLRALQAEHQDMSPVWLTEIGYQADPPGWTSYRIMAPTQSEMEQAEFLEEVYTRLPEEAPFVERIFWFKYEDFGTGTYTRWGLVRLRDSDFQYAPEAMPWPRKLGHSVYKSLARPQSMPNHWAPRPDDEDDDRVQYFNATGQELRDPFYQYWEDNGGLEMFGYPKTRVFEVHGRKVQYFERARFEHWPEHAGTEWEVQLGLLGRYEASGRAFEPQEEPDGDHETDERTYFPQTGQFLSGAFRDYWEDEGGMDIFGFPISGEIAKVKPEDGESYVVQYFERTRFEWYPQHAGTEHEVQLGLLGNEVLAQPGWRR